MLYGVAFSLHPCLRARQPTIIESHDAYRPGSHVRAPCGPFGSRNGGVRLTLRGVSWSLYDQLLAVVGDGLPRMTYDRGLLELEMPSKTHETLKWIAGRFIEAYAEESGVDYDAAGSTTWRRAAIQGGLEADESYYIQNYARVRGREVDLSVDPPPDLAIEIDLSPPDIEKSSVYARLGVPEIWRWRDGRLVCSNASLMANISNAKRVWRCLTSRWATWRAFWAAIRKPTRACGAQFRSRVREKSGHI